MRNEVSWRRALVLSASFGHDRRIKRNILTFLTLACVLAVGVLRSEAKPPNVVVMICDDIRWDCLGCTGHPHLQTPQIERLAAEGVNFRNIFCTTSLCSPSRASILSGLYAHAHGVRDNFTEYPETLKSFPQVLQSTGYDTAYIGKYHMGEDNDAPRPGFNWFVTHWGQGQYFDTECNLINDPAQKERVAELAAELETELRALGIENDTMPLDEGIKTELPDAKIR